VVCERWSRDWRNGRAGSYPIEGDNVFEEKLIVRFVRLGGHDERLWKLFFLLRV
jgi:hypothetical protein